MIRTVIIDDVLTIREEIRDYINNLFNAELLVIGEADSVLQGVKIIDTLKPSLVLLDIELIDGYSFDIFEKLKFTNFQVIFITGFNEHAIKAIKLGALDYILKPIDLDEFKTAIHKAIKSNKSSNENLSIQANVSNDYFKGVKNKRIVLKTMETHYIVYLDDIIYCHSDGNYTTFYLNDGKEVLLSKPMNKIENLIDSATFFKCHQSYLINENYIDRFLPEGFLILKNNIKIPIASRRKEFVVNKINKFESK